MSVSSSHSNGFPTSNLFRWWRCIHFVGKNPSVTNFLRHGTAAPPGKIPINLNRVNYGDCRVHSPRKNELKLATGSLVSAMFSNVFENVCHYTAQFECGRLTSMLDIYFFTSVRIQTNEKHRWCIM